jgi:alpha-ribazole phosphatase
MIPSPPAPGAKRLLAVRHAPTLSAGLCVGDADVPCAIPAPQAAEEILCLVGSRTFQEVWSSPSERCLMPARLVADRLALPLHVDDGLKEIHLGRWQMQPWTAIVSFDPVTYHAWMADWLTQAPPEGERPEQLSQRVSAWWNSLCAGDHLLVAHAGVVRALHVLTRGMSWPEAMQTQVMHLEGYWFGTA